VVATVEVRSAEVLLGLRNGSKRMVYAVANAARATVLAVQVEERLHAATAFTLRGKRDFLLRQAAVITFPRPTSGVVEARVRVGEKPGLLLASYEAGFTRVPKRGSKVAVPAAARPEHGADIPAALWIRNLNLHRNRQSGVPTGKSRASKGGLLVREHIQHDTAGKGAVQGAQRTYTTPAGIFQRMGRNTTRLLYGFARPYRVSERLRFITTGLRIVHAQFAAELRRQVQATLDYSLRGGGR